MQYISNSEQETYEIACNLASQITNNVVICLNGEMGAGKTVFVRGFASYFNITDTSSPTFTIVNEYKGNRDVYHFDVYRLADEDEFYDIGGEEYFEKGICIIEWSKIIEDALPKNRIEVTIEKIDENQRKIEVKLNE
ncbi:MAG: tRNA (adenosine(37)-N6)-threonylcarbamoyltransferase complex ATPase subunit type 1 TsaE [Clostridiales bacterium]|nr:tRNA (adenosine(37)-N6)-threonylcarbamoyltransferase complex ATPase subunit type 1 TsaE [Clostridiales bacterium]